MLKTTLYALAFITIVIINTASSCSLKFSGASIPTNVKSVTINNFPNQSAFIATSLSQTFTEELINKFNSESNLVIADRNGDWEFNGAIISYVSTPIAPTGNETTALNRLTIGVKVDFTNRLDETLNWTQTFSRYADYESTKLLNEIENDLILEISKQLADDIFLKVAGNW